MGKVKNIVIGSAVAFIGFIAIETSLAQDNPKSGAQTQKGDAEEKNGTWRVKPNNQEILH